MAKKTTPKPKEKKKPYVPKKPKKSERGRCARCGKMVKEFHHYTVRNKAGKKQTYTACPACFERFVNGDDNPQPPAEVKT